MAQGNPEVVQRHALTVPVASLPEDGEGVLVRGDGLLEPGCLAQGGAEVVQRDALTVPVAGLLVGGCGALVYGDGLLEPPYLAGAKPRLFIALISPCRSPVSRKTRRLPARAVMASSNRPTSRRAMQRFSTRCPHRAGR